MKGNVRKSYQRDGVGMIPLKVTQAGKSEERETAWKIQVNLLKKKIEREMRNGI